VTDLNVAGAPEGSRCRAIARLDEVRDGRKLRFSVQVLDADGRTVGVGTHERRVIDAS
jgi:predicted thioesterase